MRYDASHVDGIFAGEEPSGGMAGAYVARVDHAIPQRYRLGELDYLIIDMPPGTGDVALTLSQLLPLTGAVIVCTPQEVALLDAGKAIAMFEKTKIPILGVVENMSGFTDPETGKTYDIFGRGGARAKAEELQVPFLGEVPIQIALRRESDEGRLAEALQDPVLSKPFEAVC